MYDKDLKKRITERVAKKEEEKFGGHKQTNYVIVSSINEFAHSKNHARRTNFGTRQIKIYFE